MGVLYSKKEAKHVSYSKNTTGVRVNGEKTQRHMEPAEKPLPSCGRELMELASEVAGREGAASGLEAWFGRRVRRTC